MAESHISEAMRAAQGRQMRRRVSYPVSASDIRRWALAVYYPEPPPPRFVDPDESRLIAPQEFNPFSWRAAQDEGLDIPQHDPDRTELTLGVEGPHLQFQLNGGMEAEYGAPMRPGDVITSVKRLTGYRERQGRMGLMLFSFTDEVWTNQRDEQVLRTRTTLIRY